LRTNAARFLDWPCSGLDAIVPKEVPMYKALIDYHSIAVGRFFLFVASSYSSHLISFA
jgi:hypothetical protein